MYMETISKPIYNFLPFIYQAIIILIYLYLFQVYGQTDIGQYIVLFWEPITDASVLELRINRYHLTSACFGIKLYGCVSSEGAYHNVLMY